MRSYFWTSRLAFACECALLLMKKHQTTTPVFFRLCTFLSCSQMEVLHQLVVCDAAGGCDPDFSDSIFKIFPGRGPTRYSVLHLSNRNIRIGAKRLRACVRLDVLNRFSSKLSSCTHKYTLSELQCSRRAQQSFVWTHFSPSYCAQMAFLDELFHHYCHISDRDHVQ